jgi:hypothetical protein
VTGANGKPQDCTPYKCTQAGGGSCITQCKSVNDCVSPAVCEPSGACVAPSSNGATGASSGGCACAAAGAAGSSDSACLFVVGAGAMLGSRRTRKASRSRKPTRPSGG